MNAVIALTLVATLAIAFGVMYRNELADRRERERRRLERPARYAALRVAIDAADRQDRRWSE